MHLLAGHFQHGSDLRGHDEVHGGGRYVRMTAYREVKGDTCPPFWLYLSPARRGANCRCRRVSMRTYLVQALRRLNHMGRAQKGATNVRGKMLIVGSVTAGWLISAALIYFWQDAFGFLVGVFTATWMAVFAIRRWVLQTERAFIHGYHAGYHAGHQTGGDCIQLPCGVIDLAEQKAHRLRSMVG